MEKVTQTPQKRLILTILLREEAKKYKLSQDQADSMLRVLETHYKKENMHDGFADIKDELVKLIVSSKIISVNRNGDKIEICLEPSE